MSDWAVGDLAVCVDDAPETSSQDVIVQKGAVYRVAAVTVTPGNQYPALLLSGVIGKLRSGEGGVPIPYRQYRFRKILPDQHEPCEQDFVTLLKRRKVPA